MRRKSFLQQLTVYTICLCIFAMYPAQAVMAQTAAEKLKRFIYVYSPGYNLNADTKNNIEARFNNLTNGIYKDTDTDDFNVSIYATTIGGSGGSDDEALTIRDQTYGVKNNVEFALTDRTLDKLILVGQSQGGIRARTFLQLQSNYYVPNVKQNPTNPDDDYVLVRNRVKGLATISSPNQGGPILNNGVGIMRREVGILTSHVLQPLLWGTQYFSIVPGVDQMLRQLDDQLVNDNPGVVDMKAGSDLLHDLNDRKQQACKRYTYYITKRFLWHTWKEAVHKTYCYQTTNPDFRAIPANTTVMSVVTKSSSDQMISSLTEGKFTGSTRVGLAVVTSLWTAQFTAISFIPFQWWAIPIAMACFAATQFLWRMPSIYNTMVGSPEHDGLFPTYSQVIPASAGGRNWQTCRIDNSPHDITFGGQDVVNGLGALGVKANKTAECLRILESSIQ